MDQQLHNKEEEVQAMLAVVVQGVVETILEEEVEVLQEEVNLKEAATAGVNTQVVDQVPQVNTKAQVHQVNTKDLQAGEVQAMLVTNQVGAGDNSQMDLALSEVHPEDSVALVDRHHHLPKVDLPILADKLLNK